MQAWGIWLAGGGWVWLGVVDVAPLVCVVAGLNGPAVLCSLGGCLPLERGRPHELGWCRPPRLGLFPPRGCSSFSLLACCSSSPVLWPFSFLSPAVSGNVSRVVVPSVRGCQHPHLVVWGAVVLISGALRSRCLPPWIHPSHPVQGPVVGGRESVWWMQLVWCRVRLGRLARHGGCVSLGLPLFVAHVLVRRRPVGALPPSDVVDPQVAIRLV